jgi:hypothetical protein
MWGRPNRLAACGLTVALGAMAIWPRAGVAQDRGMPRDRMMVTSTVSVGSPGAAGAVSRKSVERWAGIVGMSDDQREAALALLEGYRAEYDAAQKEMNDAMAEARRAFEESQDPAVFGEKMPQARRKFVETSRRAERVLMADLRSLLTAEQEEDWARVERMRRREIGGRMTTVSGDAVDLVEIVEGLKLAETERADVAETLEAYEQELDRAIQARLRAMDAAPDLEPGRPINMEQLQARMAESREIGLRLKEINHRSARKLESMLPEEKRAEFGRAVKLASFPRVYRPTHASRVLEAAAKLSDLDAPQLEQVEALRAQYEREITAANEALAAAIEKDEADPKRGGSMGGPGGGMVMRFGDENEDLASARRAKRELDERTRKKLSSILRPEQEERLPKPEPEGEMFVPAGGGGVGHVIVR